MRCAFPRELLALAAALALFLGVDALLFGTPLYRAFLDPASTAGSFERGLALARSRSTDPGRDVLVLGDSRIYNGFDAALASRSVRGFRFVNASVPGTTPRCWTVFDGALDPGARRYRAVVIPVDTYADDDGALGSVDGDDRLFDLRYLPFSATPADIVRIARSFPEPDRRLEAAFELALRGPLVREDLQAFALDPRGRLAAIAAARGSEGPPHARAETMVGLRVAPDGTVVAPPSFPASERAELLRQVRHVPQPSASYARYRREWLGLLVARYRATGTPVLIVRIPTRPLEPTPPATPSGTLAGFARSGAARLLPQAPYVALERPNLFADAVHLNATGAARFSVQLAHDVERTLSDPDREASTYHLDSDPPAAASVRSTAASTGAPPVPAAAPATVAAPASATANVPAAAPDAPAVAEGARSTPGAVRHDVLQALEIGSPLRFTSFEYAVFFGLVVVAFYLLRSEAARRGLLLLTSWYFYARWNAWYLAVLLALTVTDYAFGLGVERAPPGRRRRALLTAGIAVNLLFLGTAKYADFLSGTLAALLRMPADPWALHVLVPVGISFHTFQSISYLVDVSRGKTKAVRNPLDYALYLAFFPQLLAGPIVRAGLFFAELARRHVFEPANVARGLGEIGVGLLEKVVLADRFGAAADAYFAAPAAHPGAPAAWCGAFAFALQIYFDFAGYSDIAIGSARVLGFAFPENFRRPYLAWSVTEFWRRWHMTLSAWLRDYVYIPLGGNRGGPVATYRNLLLTMLLGGLWHGANWTFVAWGGYHGVLLALERRRGVARDPADAPRGAARVGATAVTFVLVLAGWVLFRARTFGEAFGVLHGMVAGGPGPVTLSPALFALAAGALAVEIALERGLFQRRPLPFAGRAAAFAALLLALELASDPGPAATFVYFKF